MNSHRFKLHRSLIWQMLAKYPRVESERTVSKFKRGKDNFCVVFTYFIKQECESRKFHVAGVQRRQRTVQIKIAWCTSKFVVLSIKTYYFFLPFSFFRRRRWFCCHPERVLPWWRDAISTVCYQLFIVNMLLKSSLNCWRMLNHPKHVFQSKAALCCGS